MLQMALQLERNDVDVVREASERLYQVEGNITSLSYQELFYLLLGRELKRASVTSTVAELLEYKQTYGLKNLTVEQLQMISGIGEGTARKILAAIELGRRIYSEPKEERCILRSPEDAANYLVEMKHLSQEHFVALFLTTKNEVLGKKTVFIGSLNASIVHPREVFKEAILRSAASIVVAHNHPSGNPEPSREDIEVTKRLVEVGKTVGIELLDHLIIGDSYVSLKEKGYV